MDNFPKWQNTAKDPYRLFLFRCPFPCFQAQILQSLSLLVFLGKPQGVIIQLQGVKYPKINAYRHSRDTFFNARYGQRRTSSPLCHLSHAQIPS